MAKLMLPETEQSLTAGTVRIEAERPWANVIDAAAEGAGAGLQLALNVAAMLLAFLGLIALVNAGLGWLGGLVGFEGLTLEGLLGQILRPLAWVMGTPWAEADKVGALIGIKTGANEFVAYTEMGKMIDAGQLSERSRVIATYALCGFSNFSSIAIQIGGIGALAPERKSDLASSVCAPWSPARSPASRPPPSRGCSSRSARDHARASGKRPGSRSATPESPWKSCRAYSGCWSCSRSRGRSRPTGAG